MKIVKNNFVHPKQTVPLFITVVMYCCYCVICEVNRVGGYYGFNNIRFPHLDLHQSGIFSLPWTNSRKIDLGSGQTKREIQDRSRKR